MMEKNKRGRNDKHQYLTTHLTARKKEAENGKDGTHRMMIMM
jgi:hypothetical protein